MKKRLVVGNWKMYVEEASEARAFGLQLRRKARSLSGVDVWLAPPFIFLPSVAQVLESSPVKVGAQAVSSFAEGAHTGDVSAHMLKEAGANFAIVGHSERRIAGDTNERVRQQLERTIEAGLSAIVCIGERERDKEGEHFEFLEAQINSAFLTFPFTLSKVVIAYEPVWAIGKRADEAMQPHDLQEMTIFIKKTLTDILGREKASRVPILYGGSVEPENAGALVQEGTVDGLLVGHASQNFEQFFEIIKACKK
ncbi:triose-phosphate isomerase [Acetobacteraceae bacterium]|nr:triose-phosphate isomerase [Candidatus Parcubacteria bacterium]